MALHVMVFAETWIMSSSESWKVTEEARVVRSLLFRHSSAFSFASLHNLPSLTEEFLRLVVVNSCQNSSIRARECSATKNILMTLHSLQTQKIKLDGNKPDFRQQSIINEQNLYAIENQSRS